MSKCDRCYKETIVTTMSFFDASMCCPDCIKVEKTHPQYEEAHRREVEEVKRGNYNFPGIGLPNDLRIQKEI